MLQYNSFRADRYLRSRFVDGRYFLAEEASDLELEMIDLVRRNIENMVGDVAINNAWLVSLYASDSTNRTLLVSPGEAWFKGLPYNFRAGQDQLVSGSGGEITAGQLPAGVSLVDEPNGLGKEIIFSPSTTSANYTVVIQAQEQVITNTDDPFLKNLNVPEATGQKMRLVYKLNVVPTAEQLDNTSGKRFNPSYTGSTSGNLSNTIQINPISGNGTVVSTTVVTGSQTVIDGRKVNVTINNPSGFQQFPFSLADQSEFENGTLIDTLGNYYHISAINNSTTSGQVVLSLDSEVGQPIIPQLPTDSTVGGSGSYSITKQDVYYTDDSTGFPTGSLYWPIATVNFTSSGFVHSSVIVDLRGRILDEQQYDNIVNTKFQLATTGGGVVSFATDSQTLSWGSAFNIINPSGPLQTIAANTVVIVADGALVYNLNIANGGVISLGNTSITVGSTTGTVLTLTGSPSLAITRLGNIIQVGSQVSTITAIDNVNKTITVNVPITNTGSGTIYNDSFAAGMAPINETSYTLAVSDGSQVIIADRYTLIPGTSNAIYDERILYPSGLAANTTINLPANSRNGGATQSYDPIKGTLQLFINQLYKYQSIDWTPVLDGSTGTYHQIQIPYALTNDTELHFRIDDLPAGSLGGSSGSSGTLQAAYNAGTVINVTSGSPVTLNGTAGNKLIQVNGDMGVTGVVDPLGITFTPSSSSPLQPSQYGLYVDNSGNLMYIPTTSSPAQNITAAVNAITTSSNTITDTLLNSTGSTIMANTPVYSPSSGTIAPANGTTFTTSKLIGVTINNIPTGTSGLVAIAGIVSNFTGYTHGAYVYLDQNAGTLVTTPPATPTYPTGFNVVLVGIVQGTKLYLRLQDVGIL